MFRGETGGARSSPGVPRLRGSRPTIETQRNRRRWVANEQRATDDRLRATDFEPQKAKGTQRESDVGLNNNHQSQIINDQFKGPTTAYRLPTTDRTSHGDTETQRTWTESCSALSGGSPPGRNGATCRRHIARPALGGRDSWGSAPDPGICRLTPIA